MDFSSRDFEDGSSPQFRPFQLFLEVTKRHRNPKYLFSSKVLKNSNYKALLLNFQYRIEANDRQQLGGIWEAPSSYSFLCANNSQTDVQLLKKFGDWVYSTYSVKRRMPWLCNCDNIFLTTDDGVITNKWWGCLVQEHTSNFRLTPFIMGNTTHTLYYWMRENRTGE